MPIMEQIILLSIIGGFGGVCQISSGHRNPRKKGITHSGSRHSSHPLLLLHPITLQLTVNPQLPVVLYPLDGHLQDQPLLNQLQVNQYQVDQYQVDLHLADLLLLNLCQCVLLPVHPVKELQVGLN